MSTMKRRKLLSLLAIVAIALGVSLSIKEREQNTAKAYAALGYYEAKKELNPEAGLAISLVGVWHSGLTGAVTGMAFGNLAGALVGGAIGV